MKIVVSLILFIIPFFWLKPGEMDLGGDSSRLYFYDPISYIYSQTLYSIVSSGVGGEAISYYALPFFLLLAIFKSIFNSQTILISAFNGMSLSVAFTSCYLIIKELVNTKKTLYEKNILEYASVLAGLFYVFAPYLINGWDKALLTHNQIFLNPLMFFLLLRFFLTHNSKYLLGLLLLTFIFAPNFAYVAAPAFFAFYPLSFIFLLIYTKYIRKRAIPVKGLFIGGILFILLQTFHLMPHLMTLFSPGSGANEAVFSSESKFSRGLSYFSAIAPNIKVSLHLMNLSQLTELKFSSFISIIFPIIILLGFLWNNLWDKRKTMLPTGIFFLIILFFVSANITDTGLNFYKALFNIPGFSMFRNFYGQWGFVFVFFYTILLGQSLVMVLSRIKKYYAYLLIIFIAAILIINAWSFINGALVNKVLFESKDVKIAIRMDPEYEKVLSFIRSLPIDGKVLTLPLNDPGYQILTGKDGGAYQGPSTISYLTGRNDFSGYSGLSPFSELFLRWVREKDYLSLQRLFYNLNIRYIFYNSDPYIYDQTFPKFPYNYVKNFLPKNQQSYKKFLEQFPIYKIKDFGEKYHIFSIKDDLYLPHIFVASDTIYSTNPLIPYSTLNVKEAPRFVVLNLEAAKKGDNIMIKADNNNQLNYLINNYHLHRHEPFISRELDDFFYTFVLLREKFELWKIKNNPDQYLDFSLLYVSKRIFELDKFEKGISVLKTKWEEPKIWEFYKFKNYNSWEANLARYEKGMGQLIEWVAKSSMPESWQDASRIKINEQLLQHEVRLQGIIKNSNTKEDEKTYLLSLAKRTFASVFNKLALDIYDPFTIKYSLNIPKNQDGEYEVYLKKEDDTDTDLSKANIEMDGGKILKPIKENQGNSLVQLKNIYLKDKKDQPFILKLNPTTLINDSGWQGSGGVKDTNGSPVIVINNFLGNNSGGLIKEVIGWKRNKQYLISFDSLTYGDDFIFKFYEKKSTKGQEKTEKASAYFEKNLNSVDWKTHQSVLTSGTESVEAFMQIHSNNDNDTSNIAIKNISVTEIPNPTIVFKKVLPANNNNAVRPKILFTKINPTKYRVQVKGATGPYTLVFLEQFNGNWALQDVNKDTKSIKGFISRLWGNIGRIAVGVFVKDKLIEKDIAASYFNGEVNEGFHRNTFLEPRTFETWGKEVIASGRHFQANGYANAWNIEPSDMNGKTDYTLILEMTTQKKFYFFLAVSILTVISLLLYFLLTTFQKNEKNN